MDFLHLAKERYSVRKFSSKEIEAEKISAIIEAGRIAPTAKNNQPQKIYVAKSEQSVALLNECSPCIYGAPVVLVVAYDQDRDWKSTMEQGRRSGEIDCAIICSHMMLEAADLGLGSCCVGMFNNNEVKEKLGLPENVTVCALLPIGYAAEGCEPSERHTIYRDYADTVQEI